MNPLALHLVIVNDNPADRAMLRRMMNSSDLDADFVEISTARELFKLPLHDYDCVLLDHRLPDRDGIDALVEVCNNKQFPPCPMIVMSSHGDENTAARAFKAGANDYLVKDTLTPSRLSGTIINAVDKWHTEETQRHNLALQRDALQIAERANLAKTQFIAGLSHQIRLPLTAILGFSQLIQDAELGDDKEAWDKYKDYAGDINQSARHVFDLMSGIIQLVQLESGNASISPSTFNPCEVLRETISSFDQQTDAARIEIIVDDQRAPHLINSDHRVLKTIMTNLLSNAIKFTPTGKTISVKLCELDGAGYLFSVSDTGVGMKAEDLQHLTKPFERYKHNDVSLDKGVGIGLPLVNALVKSLGGDIYFETAPAEGFTATVIIPVTDSLRALP